MITNDKELRISLTKIKELKKLLEAPPKPKILPKSQEAHKLQIQSLLTRIEAEVSEYKTSNH
jgi:hypothetical protein